MQNTPTAAQYQVLYSNFDALDIAFQGALPAKRLTQLDAAKKAAQLKEHEKRGEAIPFGKSKAHVEVAPVGVKGFGLQLSTGHDGEVWFIKRSTNKEGWNIRVSVRSAAFIGRSLDEVIARLYERLEDWGATIIMESVGRVDFAVDFGMDKEWQLQPDCIIAHSNATASVNKEAREMHLQEVMSGRRCTGVTVGKMPNRQICIYDKTKEIIAKRKDYWRKVWRLDERPEVERVWRVEMRAGKRHLKEDWQVSTIAQLKEKVGDIFAYSLLRIRLHDYEDDNPNITRRAVHEVWKKLSSIVKAGFTLNGECPNAVKECHREQAMDNIRKVYETTLPTFARVFGIPENRMEEAILPITRILEASIRANSDKNKERHRRAGNRYWFVDEGAPIPENEKMPHAIVTDAGIIHKSTLNQEVKFTFA